jgi:hypothetical protein
MIKPQKHRIFRDGELVEVEGHLADVHDLHPVLRRMKEYNIGQQLNLLYDDINNGVFGEQAKEGKFFAYVKSIKDKYPKN